MLNDISLYICIHLYICTDIYNLKGTRYRCRVHFISFPGPLFICKMEIIICALIILDRYQVVVLWLWGVTVYSLRFMYPLTFLPKEYKRAPMCLHRRSASLSGLLSLVSVRVDSPGAPSPRSRGEFTNGPGEPWTGHRAAL